MNEQRKEESKERRADRPDARREDEEWRERGVIGSHSTLEAAIGE